MTFALSKKDQCLLVGLLGALFLIVSWFYVASPMQEKTMNLQNENIALKAKADLYQSINANLPKYEQGIEEMKEEIVTISNQYPVHISREDEIMFLANMENLNSLDLAVENITMSMVQEVTAQNTENVSAATEAAGTTVEGVAAQMPEIHLYKQPVNYSFRCTYKGAKDMITYLYAQTNKKGIENMTLAFDSETGNLMGSVDLNQFYMLGIEKEYQSIGVPAVPKGVNDVFHTRSE